MKRLVFLLIGFPLFFGCQSESQDSLKPLNLLEYGLPITIMAPDSAEVKSSDLGGLLKDVTIKKGDDFSIQIYASAAETTDIAKVKANQIAEVKSNRYFSKIVEEKDNGFIYETAIDSSNINYGFRYIRVQGDQEYIFQTALIGTFDEEAVRNMYKAVGADGK